MDSAISRVPMSMTDPRSEAAGKALGALLTAGLKAAAKQQQRPQLSPPTRVRERWRFLARLNNYYCWTNTDGTVRTRPVDKFWKGTNVGL